MQQQDEIDNENENESRNVPRSDIMMMKKTSRLMMWMDAWKSDHEGDIMSIRLAHTVLPLIHVSLPDMKENRSCFVQVPSKKKM
jgi:hypothetical protein